MAIFKKTQAGETTVYTNVTEGRQVKAEDLDPALKEELDLADLGTAIDDESITKGDGDGVVDANGNPIKTETKGEEKGEETPSAPKPPKTRQNRAKQNITDDEVKGSEVDDEPVETKKVNPYRKAVPQSEKGFGFPRKNGKTGDIFDVNVPHTQVRAVAGMLVPVSDENYKTKTDEEIYTRLEELELV